VFATEILPRIPDLTAGQIAAATGLSQHYAALIKRGRKIPHPRHWSALQTISSHAGAETDNSVLLAAVACWCYLGA
jgi:hypothetical protein